MKSLTKTRTASLYVCIMLVLALTACGTNHLNQSGEKGDSNGMETEQLEFRVEETSQLPENVQDALTELLNAEQEGSRLVVSEERTYIMIALGERPTGGFDVNVSHVEKGDETITIKAIETKPPTDAIVTQVLTYPHTVISIQGDYSSYDLNLELTEQS